MIRCLLVVGSLMVATAAHAGVVTLNFDSLTTNDALEHFLPPVYTEDGFTLTATHDNPQTNPSDFAYFGTLAPQYPGETMLFHHDSLGEITLTRSDGGAFDLFSMELAEVPNLDVNGQPVSTSFDITFTGTRADGSAVAEVFNGAGFPAVSTVLFSGFTDLESVHWFQGPGGLQPGDGAHQFDNIAVQAVPEPSTIVFFSMLFPLGFSALTRLRQS